MAQHVDPDALEDLLGAAKISNKTKRKLREANKPAARPTGQGSTDVGERIEV